jgi:hypothetical protein
VADSFVCVADTDSSMAPTTIVPDSARLQDSPPPFSDASRMPGLMSFTGKAGDAMLMDIRTWHAAMPNTSNLPRESIIIQFAASKWQQTGTMISSAKRLERQRAEFLAPRPILRQMLGLGIAPELADTGSFPTEEEVGPWPLRFAPPYPSELPAHAAEADIGLVTHFRREGCESFSLVVPPTSICSVLVATDLM